MTDEITEVFEFLEGVLQRYCREAGIEMYHDDACRIATSLIVVRCRSETYMHRLLKMKMATHAAWRQGQSFDEAAIYPGSNWHKSLTSEMTKAWDELRLHTTGVLKKVYSVTS